MASLNPLDQAGPFARQTEVRLNWRLLVALTVTAGFWVVAGEAIARLA